MQNTKRYLIACDFDDTLFETSKPSPSGLNVKKAYEMALRDIFGTQGNGLMERIGLNSQSPSEIARSCLTCGENGSLVFNAGKFHQSKQGEFGYPIPECEEGKVKWDEDNPERPITQMLVGQKLKYLMDEIGKVDNNGVMWPPPCKDALVFLDIIGQLKTRNLPVDLAVISSGHESFIRNSFDAWELHQPDVLVTEDDIRPRPEPQAYERRYKPGQIPLAIAHREWLLGQELAIGKHSLIKEAQESKARIVYIGDSMEKDMKMAERGRVLGLHYPTISWRDFSMNLLANSHLFDGRPFSEIIKPSFKNPEGVVMNYAGLGYSARK